MFRLHPNLRATREEIEAFCEKWGLSELALFGSATRDDFGPESDFDVMVDFFPGAKISLWKMIDLQDELAKLLGRKTDIIQKGTISNPYKLASIERDLTVVYAA